MILTYMILSALSTERLDLEIEANIIQLCKKHDRRAQYELYRNCYSFLMSICSRYERNKEDAEELLNQSFLKILTNLDKYREEVPIKLWMRKITINTIIDEFRKSKKMKELTKYTDFSEENYPGTLYDINDYLKKTDAEEILKMIDGLPEISRNVFNMYVIDGLSHKEIGDLLGFSDGTSRWYLNAAKTELKEKLSRTNLSTHFN